MRTYGEGEEEISWGNQHFKTEICDTFLREKNLLCNSPNLLDRINSNMEFSNSYLNFIQVSNSTLDSLLSKPGVGERGMDRQQNFFGQTVKSEQTNKINNTKNTQIRGAAQGCLRPEINPRFQGCSSVPCT